MLFKALPESHSKPVICDQSNTQTLYTSKIYRQVIFIQQKFATIASVRTTGNRVPSSDSSPSTHSVSWRSHSRSPVLGRTSHGDTKTRRKVPARNADVLVGIIASLRFQVSGFSIFRRPSSRPDSIASLPIRIPARISRGLGSLRWGCSMQGGIIKMLEYS